MRPDAHSDRTLASPAEMLEHSLWVRRLARALVLDASSADDLAQGAWVRALETPPRAGDSIRPWFGRVVRNLAIIRNRSETRRTRREALRPTRGPAPGSDEVAISLETQQILLDAVRQLSDPLRSTLVRHYFHGRTSVEIAREDGVAESTVRGRLKEAVDGLRKKLDDRHRGDRAAWMALLVPLTAPRSSAGAVAGALLSMNLLVKCGIGTALALGAIVAWRGTRTESLAPSGGEGSAAGAAIDLARGGVEAPERAAARTAVSETDAPSAAPTAAAVDPTAAIVEARIVDAQGAPIPGAKLICTDRVGPKDLKREEAPQATSDERGLVRIALSRDDASRNQGRDPSMSEDEWFATLEVGAVAHAHVTLQHLLKSGRTAALGDVVLTEAGDIVGRVVDPAGQALADADVELGLPGLTIDERESRSRRWGPNRFRIRSASDGSFAMRGIPCGLYRLWALKSGMLAGISDILDVRAGEELRAADLVVAADARTVRGRAVDGDGHPCPHPEVDPAGAGPQ